MAEDKNQSGKLLALIFIEKLAEAFKEAAQQERALILEDREKPETSKS